MANMQANAVGKKGEALAVQYLQKQGYTILQTNYVCGVGELDIIATINKQGLRKLQKMYNQQYKQNPTPQNQQLALMYADYQPNQLLVIVEVKARSSAMFGLPQEAVTKHKQHKIKLCTQWYMQQNHMQHMQVRFDCIAILDENIEHIQNAFM